MSSPGLLFLLLVSSCLSVRSTPPGSSLGEGQLEQVTQKNQQSNIFKKLGSWLKKHYRDIGEVMVATIEPVPGAGPPIAGALKTLLLLSPAADTLDTVASEIKALHVKLDLFHAEMKWAAWAAGAYLTPVRNIEKAWVKYTELVHSYQRTTNTEKEELKTTFFTFYSQYEDSTVALYQFLTAKPGSLTQKLGDLLADRLRCHEKDVKAQFLYLNELVCKGNLLNERYYEFKGTNNKDRINTALKIASQSASALFTSHQRCISDSAAHIERDVFELIDDTRKHQDIADSIRSFLVKTYDRYDWMVVAFTTQNSKHKPKLLKRHTVSGFIEVARGTVTVAIAKQVKGSHRRSGAVIEAIKKCLPERRIICLDVAQTLMTCQEEVFGKSLSQAFTAVHAFKKNSQTSTNAVEVPDDEDATLPESAISLRGYSSLTPHLFTGKCGKMFGTFIVFIKSDEEIMGEDPCSRENCGRNGKCVVVPGTFIAMCECQYPYYGDHCEVSCENYKRQLPQESERTTQTPHRFRKAGSAPPASRRSRKSTSPRPSRRRSRKSTSSRSSRRRSRKSTSPRSSRRRSRKSTSPRSSRRRSRKSTSPRPSRRRSRKSTSPRSSRRRSRKSTSSRSSRRRSRKSTSPRPSRRRSRKSTSPRSSRRRSRKSTSPRSSSRRSQRSTSRDSSQRRSQQRRSTLGRLNRGSWQHNPGRQTEAKSFCGSLCADETTDS